MYSKQRVEEKGEEDSDITIWWTVIRCTMTSKEKFYAEVKSTYQR